MSDHYCVYENHTRGSKYCIALTKKECENCSFFRSDTFNNWKKYYLDVERDILKYSSSKKAVS